MAQADQLSDCPSCAEPLEEGDLFCGACGADLRALAEQTAAGGDRPTIPVNGALPPPPAGAPASGTPPAGAPASGAPAGPGPPRGHGAPEPTPAHTPTEPDFTLPPAVPAGQAPVGGPARGAGYDWHERATEEPAGPGAEASPPLPPLAPSPQAAASASQETPVDPRTADPQALRDDSPGLTPDGLTPDGAGPDGAADGAGLLDGPASGEPEALGPRCVACGTGTIDDDGYCEHCGHKQPHARDHMEHELRYLAAASDRGLRHHRNEDFFAIDAPMMADGTTATIAVVCDGVSSASRSDEASAAAAEAACASMCVSVPRGVHTQTAMHEALIAAAEAVNALATDADAEAQRNAPACTIVSAVIAGGLLTVGWVGDSRAYWVPEDRTARAARLTEDDSWAAQMVAAGLMTEADAYADARAHAITGWLGADAYDLDPHTASFKPDRPGVVVVCTDGLWNYAESAEEMAAAVPPDARTRPLHCAQHLVGYALDAGGHDNVTVALVPFPAPDEGAGSA
ncbi:serine/threonine-protein phosphatase [Streptomyces armeniacus]|uniref:Serine/threonine-protein phosphatase n=1 Tax=Streptomyces armeniacus TaxID=83291 RepID=A0A345Y121_9ACTN|nr:protein phosphatase 2C domain-containing protein [Streptomyces armeniacus]AXK37587.1 serine/threonine-protein phosphatase [Streptomyces armeniacus]